jgi:hypothetical protein
MLDSYVLVRVSRFRERARLQRPIAPNQLLDPGAIAKINNVTVGDTVSVLQFIQKYGTHYINSYVTGNSLYQVEISKLFAESFLLTTLPFSLGFRLQQEELPAHQGETEISRCLVALQKRFVQLFRTLVRRALGERKMCQWKLNSRAMGFSQAKAQLLPLHLQQPSKASWIKFLAESS